MAPEDGTSTFHFEDVSLKRLTAADVVTGIATLVLLISLFLPWYTFTVPGLSTTLGGVDHHRFLWLAVVLSAVILTYLIVHATVGLDGAPVSKEPVLLGLTVVQLILVVIPYFSIPIALVSGVKVTMAYGAYAGLAAAIVSVIAVIVPFVRSLGSR
jgi:hypothetical protein